MKDTSYRQMVKVSALPTPSDILECVTVELATDKKPWYCDGTTWYDLTATSAGGGGTPGGSTGDVQFNNGGAFAGAANVEIDGGDLLLMESVPTTPTAGVKMFGRKLANRMLPANVGPS